MDFTNVQGEWKQIKAYIDSKASSNSQIITLKGVLQNQLDQFGLKVGVCTRTNSVISNSNNGGFDILGKYFKSKKTYEVVDASINLTVGNANNIEYRNQVLGKYCWKRTTKITDTQQTKIIQFYNPLQHLIKSIDGYYEVTSSFNNVYLASFTYTSQNYIRQITLKILDRNLNIIKTLQYEPTIRIGNPSICYLGDKGVCIYSKSTSSLNGQIIYKDGNFTVDETGKREYVSNGNSYDISSLGEIITDTLAVNKCGSVSCKDGIDYFCLYKIKDLSKNIDYNISVPIDVYGEYNDYSFIKAEDDPCVRVEYQTKLRWYCIRIYKE